MTRTDELKIRRMDGLLLLVFRELLRTGRSTAAAERLGLSQSGVSHALGRLRELFDDPLFTRRPHGLIPTRRALELAPTIDALLAMAQDAVGARIYDPASSTREFLIGAAEHLIPQVAAPLLQRLIDASPSASMTFRHLLGPEAVRALRQGEIDVALGLFDPPRDLAQEIILEDRYALVLRRNHPLLGRALDLPALAELGWVLVSPGGRPPEIAAPALAAVGLRRRVVATVPRFLSAFAVVAATDLALIAPRPLAARYARGFGLAVIDPPTPPIPLQVVALYRNAAPADPGLAWLLAELRDAMARPLGQRSA